MAEVTELQLQPSKPKSPPSRTSSVHFISSRTIYWDPIL